jgi:glutathione synthase/RimK-type ligase-like ATP-grasp enzyme
MRRYQQIASKALKTMTLIKDETIRRYIPETKWYNRETLFQMLKQYPTIFIKPDKGGGGSGILRIRRKGSDFECCNSYSCKTVKKQNLVSWIEKNLVSTKRYIIQQGISLATVNGRPFDLRLLLQKPESKWELAGMVAKIAAPGRVVTNYCKGGTPCEIKQALLNITKNDQKKMEELILQLHFLGKKISKILNNRFKGLRELGIDVGIDKENQLWVFEVNTRPQFKMFSKLSNLQMYRRIVRNHRRIV